MQAEDSSRFSQNIHIMQRLKCSQSRLKVWKRARSLARNASTAEVTFGFFLLQNPNTLFSFFSLVIFLSGSSSRYSKIGGA